MSIGGTKKIKTRETQRRRKRLDARGDKDPETGPVTSGEALESINIIARQARADNSRLGGEVATRVGGGLREIPESLVGTVYNRRNFIFILDRVEDQKPSWDDDAESEWTMIWRQNLTTVELMAVSREELR